jgi:hypothetical protein
MSHHHWLCGVGIGGEGREDAFFFEFLEKEFAFAVLFIGTFFCEALAFLHLSEQFVVGGFGLGGLDFEGLALGDVSGAEDLLADGREGSDRALGALEKPDHIRRKGLHDRVHVLVAEGKTIAGAVVRLLGCEDEVVFGRVELAVVAEVPFNVLRGLDLLRVA